MYDSYAHETKFAGYPVVDWKTDEDIFRDGTHIAVAVRTDWEDDKDAWLKQFESFLKHPLASTIPALVVGMWHYENTVEHVVKAIIANKAHFPNLKALFVGDITSDEHEISWIKQGDLSPLWDAFPNLEHLQIRGGDNLELGEIKLPKLKTLRIESGGLPREVVRSVGAADFPELESLVMWLGTENYGATTKIADLEPFRECAKMPKLKYLGLCDSDIVDQIAEFMATAPVLERLDTLDLSMGTLTDDGALALITSPRIRKLKKLDLHHHFCSDGMVKKLRELAKEGIQVDVSDQKTDRDWRFVEVGE